MPQISSQATRQAILVGDTPYDPDHPPDRLALYGPDGTILNADTLKGADGAQGPAGLPGIRWRGDFNASADYDINDGVVFDGTSWRATIPLAHPAPEPSETGALDTNPVYTDAGDWPPCPIGETFMITIPDDSTAQWRYFDLLIGGDVTFSWDSDAPLFTAPYTTDGTNHGPGINPPNPFTVTLPAGRIWVDFQDSNTRSTPNNVNMTITLGDGATAAPNLPWSLVAQKGEDGTDGAPGVPGVDGADGGPVPVGGTTGQLLAKASDTDGDVTWEDPPAGGGSGWVSVAGLPADTTFGAAAEDVGPTLTFEVGASGMVVLHASGWFWHPPSQYNVDVLVDGVSITNGNGLSFNQSTPTLASLTEAGLAVSNMLNLPSVGAMLILAPGEHTVKFYHGATNAGGHAQRIRLAAQSV